MSTETVSSHFVSIIIKGILKAAMIGLCYLNNPFSEPIFFKERTRFTSDFHIPILYFLQ